MKASNRGAVLKLLLQNGPMARRDIAQALALTPAAITNVVRDLEAQNLVGERANWEGRLTAVTRRPIPVDIQAAGAFAIGVHLGYTTMSVGVVDLKGSVRAMEEFVYAEEHDPNAIVRQICAATDRVRLAADIDPPRIIGVSVGVAGVVDPESGAIQSHLGLNWHRVAFGPLVAKAMHRPIRMVNNVQAMTVGEQLYGLAGRVNSFLVIYIGSIIGAGVMIDGRLHPGLNSTAGLIGHMRIVADGPLCSCLGRGCLDSVASNLAIVRACNDAIANGFPTTIRRHVGYPVDTNPMLSIYEGAKEGDRLAIELLSSQARYVGSAIAASLHLLDPDLVVVVGSVLAHEIALGGIDFIELVRQTARDQARLLDISDARIQPGRFEAGRAVRDAAAVLFASFLDAAPFAESPGTHRGTWDGTADAARHVSGEPIGARSG